ncbi:MAG: D-alanine--D-alanine ligase [Oscillospiraceae bacterium]|jgi:D-alanine-D-alanine ligase|nr:D-alanine--D-alanine ligase [Oscillospiraceae bacterium]
MCKLNVAILFGGNSSEHEVSRASATAIIEGISKEKYNVFVLGITKSGEWLLYSGNTQNIIDGSWEKDSNNKKAFISPDAGVKGIIVLKDDKFEILKLDVIMPVFHGKNGEDGTMQGIATLADIPFAGCGVTASAVCMDKVMTNTILACNGINKADFYWFYMRDFKKDPQKHVNEIERKIKSYPMFVKPSNAGSSVGISKVKNRDELLGAIEIASKEDTKILIEEEIVGQEIECGMLGNCDPIVSIPGEVIHANEFYSYNDKYNCTDKISISANLSPEVSLEVREVSKKAYKLLGCAGLARVDSFVEEGTNKIYVNEINTFPGFTPNSMYPKVMEHTGYGLSKLIDELINYAIEGEYS